MLNDNYDDKIRIGDCDYFLSKKYNEENNQLMIDIFGMKERIMKKATV